MRGLGLVLLVGSIGLGFAGSAQAQYSFYPTSGGDAEGLAAGPDGNVWLAAFDRIGRITPAGSLTWFTLPTTGPRDIVAGPDGEMWYAGLGTVGHISVSGTVTELFNPASGADYRAIVAGAGALWIGDFGRKSIWRVDLSGAFTEFSVDPLIPWRITFGADGALWFVNFAHPGFNRMTTSGVVTSFPLVNSPPWDCALGPDGNVWFSRSADVGFMTPAGDSVLFPVAQSKNYNAITAGSDGNLWVAGDDTFFCVPSPCTPPPERDGILRVTPSGVQTFFPFPRGNALSDSVRIAAGPDGALWLTARGGIVRFDPIVAGQVANVPALGALSRAGLFVLLALAGLLLLRR